MKPLNITEINRRVGIFAFNFTLLLSSCVFCIYTYFAIAEAEGVLLIQEIKQYEQFSMKYQLLSDQMESIYSHMRLLNTDKITNNLELQRLISDQKEKLNKIILSGVGDTLTNFVVYKELNRKINTLLSIKDSLRLVNIEEEALRNDLKACILADEEFKKSLLIVRLPTEPSDQ